MSLNALYSFPLIEKCVNSNLCNTNWSLRYFCFEEVKGNFINQSECPGMWGFPVGAFLVSENMAGRRRSARIASLVTQSAQASTSRNFEEVRHGEDSDDEIDYIEAQNNNSDSDESESETRARSPGADKHHNGTLAHDKDCGWSDGPPEEMEIPAFTGNSGLRVAVGDDPSVLDFVSLFIDDEVYLSMTEQTNLYARQYLEGE